MVHSIVYFLQILMSGSVSKAEVADRNCVLLWQQPIFTATRQPYIQHKQIGNLTNMIAKVSCGRNFNWLCLMVLLLGQLAGLTMFTVWATDCFVEEFRTTPTCKHFTLFPSPGVFEIAWLLMCTATSIFLIFHVCCRSTAFHGIRVVFSHLIRRKYFYKVVFVLFVVCIYDLVVLLNKPNTVKTVSYLLFMLEKTLTVTVMFLLNFLPKFGNNGEIKLKFWLYKIALAVYSLECYTLALLGSTIAVYKVLTVSESGTKDQPSPGVISVVDLMLLMTNNGLRYFMADFFLSKFFDESLDVLGSAHGSKKITESLGVPLPSRDEIETFGDQNSPGQTDWRLSTSNYGTDIEAGCTKLG